MGENKEKRRLKVSRIFFVKFELALKIVSRFIKGMNFIYPERFFVKSIKPQRKTYDETETDGKHFLLCHLIDREKLNRNLLTKTFS